MVVEKFENDRDFVEGESSPSKFSTSSEERNDTENGSPADGMHEVWLLNQKTNSRNTSPRRCNDSKQLSIQVKSLEPTSTRKANGKK